MQKLFNMTVAVAFFLVLVSAVSPMTFAPEGDLTDKLSDFYIYVETIGDYVDKTFTFVTETVDTLVNTFNASMDLLDDIGEWFKDIYTWFTSKFKSIFDWFTSVMQWITGAISDVLEFLNLENPNIDYVPEFNPEDFGTPNPDFIGPPAPNP